MILVRTDNNLKEVGGLCSAVDYVSVMKLCTTFFPNAVHSAHTSFLIFMHSTENSCKLRSCLQINYNPSEAITFAQPLQFYKIFLANQHLNIAQAARNVGGILIHVWIIRIKSNLFLDSWS